MGNEIGSMAKGEIMCKCGKTFDVAYDDWDSSADYYEKTCRKPTTFNRGMNAGA